MTKHYKTPVLLIEFEGDKAFALQVRKRGRVGKPVHWGTGAGGWVHWGMERDSMGNHQA